MAGSSWCADRSPGGDPSPAAPCVVPLQPRGDERPLMGAEAGPPAIVRPWIRVRSRPRRPSRSSATRLDDATPPSPDLGPLARPRPVPRRVGPPEAPRGRPRGRAGSATSCCSSSTRPCSRSGARPTSRTSSRHPAELEAPRHRAHPRRARRRGHLPRARPARRVPDPPARGPRPAPAPSVRPRARGGDDRRPAPRSASRRAAATATRAAGSTPDGAEPRKIGALGIRVERGVAYHGIALNVDVALADFDLIDPCGMPGLASTSIAAELGRAGRGAVRRTRVAARAAAVFAPALAAALATRRCTASCRPHADPARPSARPSSGCSPRRPPDAGPGRRPMSQGLFELRKDAITGWWVATVVDRTFDRERFALPAAPDRRPRRLLQLPDPAGRRHPAADPQGLRVHASPAPRRRRARATGSVAQVTLARRAGRRRVEHGRRAARRAPPAPRGRAAT